MVIGDDLLRSVPLDAYRFHPGAEQGLEQVVGFARAFVFEVGSQGQQGAHAVGNEILASSEGKNAHSRIEHFHLEPLGEQGFDPLAQGGQGQKPAQQPLDGHGKKGRHGRRRHAESHFKKVRPPVFMDFGQKSIGG